MAKAAPFHLPQARFNAFATHEWINQELLENIPVAAWEVEPPESKGRTVAAIFAPMHNVRVMGWKAAVRESKIPQQLIATAWPVASNQGTHAKLRRLQCRNSVRPHRRRP